MIVIVSSVCSIALSPPIIALATLQFNTDSHATAMTSIRKESCPYASHYCEENVYKLCEKLVQQQHQSNETTQQSSVYAVFVTNPQSQVSMQRQQLGIRAGDAQGHVLWDYHVWALVIEQAEQDKQQTSAQVLDFDTCLPFPVSIDEYLTQSFPAHLYTESQGEPHFKPLFRVIEAQHYIAQFSSNREHMAGQVNIAQPQWSCIRGAQAKSHNEMDRFRFITQSQIATRARKDLHSATCNSNSDEWCQAVQRLSKCSDETTTGCILTLSELRKFALSHRLRARHSSPPIAVPLTVEPYVQPNCGIIVIDDSFGEDSTSIQSELQLEPAMRQLLAQHAYCTQLMLPQNETAQRRDEALCSLLGLLPRSASECAARLVDSVHPLLRACESVRPSPAATFPPQYGALRMRVLTRDTQLCKRIKDCKVTHLESVSHLDSTSSESVEQLVDTCLQELRQMCSECSALTQQRQANHQKPFAPLVVLHLSRTDAVQPRQSSSTASQVTLLLQQRIQDRLSKLSHVWHAHVVFAPLSMPVKQQAHHSLSQADELLLQSIRPVQSWEKRQTYGATAHPINSDQRMSLVYQMHRDSVRLNCGKLAHSDDACAALDGSSNRVASTDWLAELAFRLGSKDKYGA